MTDKLDLDVASPDQVARVLRLAAQDYFDSANNLGCTWQSKHAGRVWNRLARELDRAANRADEILKQEGW